MIFRKKPDRFSFKTGQVYTTTFSAPPTTQLNQMGLDNPTPTSKANGI